MTREEALAEVLEAARRWAKENWEQPRSVCVKQAIAMLDPNCKVSSIKQEVSAPTSPWRQYWDSQPKGLAGTVNNESPEDAEGEKGQN